MNIIHTATSQPAWVGEHVRVTRTQYRPAPIELPHSSLGSHVSVAAGTAERTAAAGYEEIYYISGELPGGLWLHYAVPVRVRVEGDEFVADQPQLLLHSFGESPAEAILNLRDLMAEQYIRLCELNDRVSPRLARQRDLLAQLLSPRDA